MATWDPDTYLVYSEERSRPFADLLARVQADDPLCVVDLGCGPGQLTVELARRWPTADVLGLDSSPEMIDAATAPSGERVRFELADAARWEPAEPVDVIASNATLQWIPGHRALLPGWVDALAPGGWLAFQVPGNFDEPSHALLRAHAADPRFADATAGVETPAAFDAATYLADLAGLGCEVDAWETTYLHLLTGADPIFTWISGTGARPILQALAEGQRDVFVSEYKALLREAYPQQPHGTVLPFRRVFVVAHKRTSP
ncbi:MAG: trans-aconitate 2-methyltransferase [Nocardioidaceae bacterium]